MTQKERQEWIQMVPRFKDTCCSKMCKAWEEKKDDNDDHFLSCPWFFGYRTMGWPVKRLCDYSYNSIEFPDLRVEDLNDEFLEKWKEAKEKNKILKKGG